jgi:tRNA modification GTPase
MPVHVTCLTPPGTAALATLAVHGPAAWAAVRAVFHPALPAAPRPGKFWLGRMGDDLGRDEVVLTAKSDTLLEIHCHGGRQVLQWLEEILVRHGAVACAPLDFVGQTGCPAWQADVLEALARAPTVRTASILLDQYHGAFTRALAEIDAHIQNGHPELARPLLDLLIGRIPLGRHLVDPWRVVIAGAVNVGKSSLVNALAGHARSVVSHEPGTTRDVVTTRLALDGWPVEVADTAGWRIASDALEQAGIARALAARESADLVVWLLDGSAMPVFPANPLPKALFVINKMDLPNPERERWGQEIAFAARISAKTGEGLSELCQKLVERLVPIPPEPGTAVPVTPEDRDRLLAWT